MCHEQAFFNFQEPCNNRKKSIDHKSLINNLFSINANAQLKMQILLKTEEKLGSFFIEQHLLTHDFFSL